MDKGLSFTEACTLVNIEEQADAEEFEEEFED
jgi:hypothetical protein